MSRLILASASPRRKELLEQVGATFEIIPAKGEEVITKTKPEEVVMELSSQKAEEIANNTICSDGNSCYILGADTVVAFEDKILGKPKDEEDAVSMLRMLSGNTHSVFTGVSIVEKTKTQQKTYSFYEETKVTMYPMSEEEIRAYVATKEPMDKAGSYGIQGKCAIYVEQIQGDYNNVVGLPVARIYQEMKKLGIAIYQVP